MANEGNPANPSLSGAQILARLLALGAVGAAFSDDVFAIKGSADATKLARFEVDGFTTGTTRVFTLPNASITVAGINLAQTFSATQTFAGIDATSIGATTPGTGAFTTLSASGVLTLGSQFQKLDGSTSSTYLKSRSNAASAAGLLFSDSTDTLLARFLVGASTFSLRTAADASMLDVSASTVSVPAALSVTGTSTMAAINASGVATFSNATAATTPTSAAVVIAGGVGVSGDIFFALAAGTSSAIKSGLGNVIRHRTYGYSSSYSAVQVGSTAVGIGFGIDPATITGGQFAGTSADIFFSRSAIIGCPNAGATDWVWSLKIAGGNATAGTAMVQISDTGLSTIGSFASSSATAGIGYATGAGGTVTQATSKATGVTLNKVCGQITMNAAALAAGAKATFTLTNSAIAATDMVDCCVASGGTASAYRASVTAVAAGTCAITVENITAGSLSEAPVITFVIVKAVTA